MNPTTIKDTKSETISFKTKPFRVNSWDIIRLPASASAKLPSRGQVMVEGSLNGYDFQTPLEPDGRWSHWFKLDATIKRSSHIESNQTVSLNIKPVEQWPEPDIPEDLKTALQNHHETYTLWQNITPMARWEWLRWIRSTSKSETRSRRIEVACSKLKAGKRRPCCWNRNLCTDPNVSKNGVLLEPSQ